MWPWTGPRHKAMSLLEGARWRSTGPPLFRPGDNLLVDLLTQDAVIGAFGSAQSPDIVEPIVDALIIKAKTMEAEQRLEEALGCWEDAIRMAEDIGGDNLTVARGVATLNKIGLLRKLDRNDEAIETMAEDIGGDNLTVARGVATLNKIGLLRKLDRNDEAIETTAVNYLARDQRVGVEMADAIVKIALGVDNVSAHPIGIAYRALTLLIHGNVESAICETDTALRLLESGTEDRDRLLRGVVIVMKGLLVATLGRTIGKTVAEKLLSDIAEQGLIVLPTHTVHVLLQYFATIEPAEALALIESAGAIDPLQPIVVALRRELGQSPSVSRELDEVSKDVQNTIIQMRKG